MELMACKVVVRQSNKKGISHQAIKVYMLTVQAITTSLSWPISIMDARVKKASMNANDGWHYMWCLLYDVDYLTLGISWCAPISTPPYLHHDVLDAFNNIIQSLQHQFMQTYHWFMQSYSLVQGHLEWRIIGHMFWQATSCKDTRMLL